MQVIHTHLPGVLLVEPKVFGDERGYFLETYRAERYAAAGMPDAFAQDNLSFSQRGVLRGLHFQQPNAQGKLVYVLQGEVFDVAVDIRRGSPTFGHWVGHTLSAQNKRQLWVPEGFAHGFCVTSDTALFAYKCTQPYAPDCERSIRWDDPAIGINWPVASPALSDKDRKARLLAEMPPDELPVYTGEPA